MIRKSPTNPARAGVTRRSFAAGAGAAGLLAGTAPFNIVRAQGGPLKIGVILPLSGVQAGIGQSCKRGADIAPALFKQIGYTQPIEIVVVDFETNVDTARARAERLIADGCNMLSGPFDSGARSPSRRGFRSSSTSRRRRRSRSRATSSYSAISRPRPRSSRAGSPCSRISSRRPARRRAPPC
jgi:hypothetical protein